jgi:outer membrane protein assembly factor BamD
MKLRSTLPLFLPLLLILGSGVACKKTKLAADPVQGRTAKEILAEGEMLMQNNKWDEGRKVLRVIEERLPSSAEFPKAKLLLADSYFFGSTSTFPEALVEFKSFLSYFPRSEMRDYVLYRIGLCHYASIENAERDQAETRKAMESFQELLKEAPGSVYALDAKAKITQCWRRLAESELMVGIFYVKSFQFAGAERRIKALLETYPEYVDRERAYYFLGEALRQKPVPQEKITNLQKAFLAKVGKDENQKLSKEEEVLYLKELEAMLKEERLGYRDEAKGFYKKLVESYPASDWAGKASDRLVEMGQTGLKEGLDS